MRKIKRMSPSSIAEGRCHGCQTFMHVRYFYHVCDISQHERAENIGDIVYQSNRYCPECGKVQIFSIPVKSPWHIRDISICTLLPPPLFIANHIFYASLEPLNYHVRAERKLKEARRIVKAAKEHDFSELNRAVLWFTDAVDTANLVNDDHIKFLAMAERALVLHRLFRKDEAQADATQAYPYLKDRYSIISSQIKNLAIDGRNEELQRSESND